MEEEFLNLGLDIIGLGVFNYKFGSITTESPVIKASLMSEPDIKASVYILVTIDAAHNLRTRRLLHRQGIAVPGNASEADKRMLRLYAAMRCRQCTACSRRRSTGRPSTSRTGTFRSPSERRALVPGCS